MSIVITFIKSHNFESKCNFTKLIRYLPGLVLDTTVKLRKIGVISLHGEASKMNTRHDQPAQTHGPTEHLNMDLTLNSPH